MYRSLDTQYPDTAFDGGRLKGHDGDQPSFIKVSERQTDRETERQTDRQTERQRDRQIDRQRDRERDR